MLLKTLKMFAIVIITLVLIIEAIIFKYIIVIVVINYCKCSNVIICTHNPYYWFIFHVLES